MKKLLFALLVLFAGSSLMAQTAEDLITKSLKAMNNEAVTKFQTVKITGSQFNARQGQEIPIKLTFKRPDKYRMELELMGTTIIQAYNGKKGWGINPLTGSEDRQDLPEEAIPQLRQLIEIMETPLAEFGKDSAVYALDGTETIEGTSYNKIKMTEDEVTTTLYIDALTNWFYKATMKVPNEDGTEANLEFVYVEKTKVKGAILPKVVEVFFNGDKNGVIKFDEYVIDDAVDDKIFDK